MLPRHKRSNLEPEIWRRRPDLNRGWRFCRPLPYHLATAPTKMCSLGILARVETQAINSVPQPSRDPERRLERETGFEPATSTLARSHSTTELFPPDGCLPSLTNPSYPINPAAAAPSRLSPARAAARAARATEGALPRGATHRVPTASKWQITFCPRAVQRCGQPSKGLRRRQSSVQDARAPG